MVLCVDIGNTNISFGLFKGQRLFRSFDIPTRDYSYSRVSRALTTKKISASIICSVVPKLTRAIKKDLFKLTGKKPQEAGEDIEIEVKNLYRNPAQVGCDRLVNAFAGIKIYGSPLIIIDFGTAITLDVVSKDKEYLGGMILPGIGMTLDALHQKTALLPRVRLEKPKELIGRDTKTSILSGVVNCFAVAVDFLAGKIKQEIGRNARVIITGGNINFMSRFCKKYDTIEKNLTLKGLNLLAGPV